MKWTLWPECPVNTPDPENQCFRLSDIPDMEAFQAEHDLQGTNVAEADPNWFFVAPPVVLSCSAATKWRNTHCLDHTADDFALSYGGNELDWEQFYYALMSPGVAVDGIVGGTWSPSLLMRYYGDFNAQGNTVQIATWDELRQSVDRLLLTGAVTNDQNFRFVSLGDSRKVNNDSISAP